MNLTATAVRKIALPHPDEQQAVVDAVDFVGSRNAAPVAKVHAAIDRLKELRTALISAAATGKIGVGNTAADRMERPGRLFSNLKQRCLLFKLSR